MRTYLALAVVLASAAPVAAQVSNDPFPDPIGDDWAPLVVDYTDFARIPGVGGDPALMTHLLDEPELFIDAIHRPRHRPANVTHASRHRG